MINSKAVKSEFLEPKKKKKDELTLRQAVMLLFLSLAIYGITTLAFMPSAFNVSGTSMYPALQHGDMALVHNACFFMDIDIERNDVIIFNQGEKDLVKRVVGIPGDKIKIFSGILFVNDEMVETDGLVYPLTTGKSNIKLDSEEYFVLGDNRPASHDSRSFGAIKRSQILGKVFFKWRNPTSI